MVVTFKLNVNDSWTVYEIKTVYVDADNEKDAMSLIYNAYGEEEMNIDVMDIKP